MLSRESRVTHSTEARIASLVFRDVQEQFPTFYIRTLYSALFLN
jgi:hypothetical protein